MRYRLLEEVVNLPIELFTPDLGFGVDREALKRINQERSVRNLPLIDSTYVDWERRVAIPALNDAGYKPVSPTFSDNPHSPDDIKARCINCEHDGQIFCVSIN